MEMCANKESGRIDYLYGEFEDSFIYTKEDAEKLANDYRSVLSIPDNIEFAFWSLDNSVDSSTYTLAAFYEGYRIKNSFIFISVHTRDFSVYKITNGVAEDLSNISIKNSGVDPQEILTQYVMSEMGTDKVYVTETDTFIYKKELCKSYSVLWLDNEYSAIVSLGTGDLLEFSDSCKYYTIPKKEPKTVTPVATKDERGNPLNFDLVQYEPGLFDGLDSNKYYIIDSGRQIVIKGKNYKYLPIESPNYYREFAGNKTADAAFVGAEAYKSIVQAYDYYTKQLNWHSYDGKGTVIPIIINFKQDNASWISEDKVIRIGQPLKVGKKNAYNKSILDKRLDYTWASDALVLCHEYTHAVFEARIKDGYGNNKECDLAALDEAYADIMGCIITNQDEWFVGINSCEGTPTVHRDPVTFNKSDRFIPDSFIACTVYCPKPVGYSDNSLDEACIEYRNTWLDKKVNDEHSRSVPFSHVAYEIHKKKIISDDMIAKIYFDSMLGLKGDSTMKDARRLVLVAADKNGCSTAQIQDMAREFDKVNITDDEFVYYYTSGESISGDIIYDDDEIHEYLVCANPLEFALFGKGLTIYEVGGKLSEEDKAKIDSKLAQLNAEFDKAAGARFRRVWSIEYKRISKTRMEIIKEFLPADNELKEGFYNGLSSISLRHLFFIWQATESTAYDFWKFLD